MKTIMSKHILIIEVEVLQGEAEHFQTSMRVLNEMTYKQYEKMIAAVNLTQRIKHYFEDAEL